MLFYYIVYYSDWYYIILYTIVIDIIVTKYWLILDAKILNLRRMKYYFHGVQDTEFV